MLLLVEGALSGEYQASLQSEIAAADLVVGHEFGAPKDDGAGAINMALAGIIAGQFPDKPIYAAETIALALDHIAPHVKPAGVFHDTSSNTDASSGGTWEELSQVRDMVGPGKVRSLHVGHANHIGRIARQARKVGFDPVLPAGLPTDFDPESRQWWCRSVWLWGIREAAGALVLKHRGQL